MSYIAFNSKWQFASCSFSYILHFVKDYDESEAFKIFTSDESHSQSQINHVVNKYFTDIYSKYIPIFIQNTDVDLCCIPYLNNFPHIGKGYMEFWSWSKHYRTAKDIYSCYCKICGRNKESAHSMISLLQMVLSNKVSSYFEWASTPHSIAVSNQLPFPVTDNLVIYMVIMIWCIHWLHTWFPFYVLFPCSIW